MASRLHLYRWSEASTCCTRGDISLQSLESPPTELTSRSAKVNRSAERHSGAPNCHLPDLKLASA
jgi:hypothetical protein